MKNKAYFKIGNIFYDYDDIGKTIKTESLSFILNENNIKIAMDKGYNISEKFIKNNIGKWVILKKNYINNNLIKYEEIVS